MLLPLSETTLQSSVGRRIKELRTRLGYARGKRLTQDWLAEQVGVTKSSVAKWETDVQVPDGTNLMRLASALETTPQYLLSGEETPEDAVREPRVSYSAESFDYETAFRVVRLVGGKEGVTEEMKRELQKAILDTYIDECEKDGIPTGPLYEMRGRVDRGDP